MNAPRTANFRRAGQVGTFTQVFAGGKTTNDLPRDRRYHGLFLEFKCDAGNSLATIANSIGTIRILLNGVEQWNLTAKKLIATYQQRGLPVFDGYLPIYFSEEQARTKSEEINLAWDVTDPSITSFQIEIEIKAGVVNPVLKAHAEYVPGDPLAGIGLIKKMSGQYVQVAAAGARAVTLDSLPPIGGLHAIHCFEKVAGDVEKMALKVNTIDVFAAERGLADILNGRHGHTSIPGVYTARFNRSGDMGYALPTIQPNGVAPIFEMSFDMKQANGFELLFEHVGPPNGS